MFQILMVVMSAEVLNGISEIYRLGIKVSVLLDLRET
jgi:hypothetical protein